MDPFHERLARVALDEAGSFGFALAGGYAVQAHGFLTRLSSDVDLFAEASAELDFAKAVDTVIAAYQREGLQVETELRSGILRSPRCQVRHGELEGRTGPGLAKERTNPPGGRACAARG